MPAPLLKPNNQKILVIQTAFLGDIVLCTSFLRSLRNEFPEAEIVFLTTPVGASILRHQNLGISIISYDKRGQDRGVFAFFHLAKKLRDFSPDRIFCVHRSFRSAVLALLCGGEIIGFREGVLSFLFTKSASRKDALYEAEKNALLLKDIVEPKNISLFPELEFSTADQEKADQLLGGVRNFTVVAPGSVWATKRWPWEKFAEITERALAMGPVVFVGGNDFSDLEIAKNLKKRFPQPEVIDLTGQTSLSVLAAVLSRAKVVVANDSAPLHIAIAVGVPVVGIFGPTTKDLGFFPLAPEGKAAVAELEGMDCRPCGLHGHNTCPLTHFRCMRNLDSELVWNKVKNIYAQRPGNS